MISIHTGTHGFHLFLQNLTDAFADHQFVFKDKGNPVDEEQNRMLHLEKGERALAFATEADNPLYQQKLADGKSTGSTTVNALLKIPGTKSFETEGHVRRMQVMGQEFGERLGLPDSELNRLLLLITLHDIGKINIPKEILTKKAPLTAAEWKTIKKHPEIGFRIARSTEEYAHVADDILSHHEHWDGSGYPRGLKGKQIPFLARITSIIDAYEVMTSGRPYKKRVSQKEASMEIKRCSGSQFDPALAGLFLKSIRGKRVKR